MTSLQSLIDIISEKSASPQEKADAGIQLALMGDPRLGVGLNNDGLPLFAWSNIILNGAFMMGSSDNDLQAIDNEKPQHMVNHGKFRISLYPVTNVQFQSFVKSKDGWKSDRWWSSDGLSWRKGAPIWQQGNSPDNYPCVNINWFEACAYANWVEDKLVERIEDNWLIRLPTEPEWERAARGIDNRIYPWGNEFDKLRCNMKDTGLGSLCSVGIFPLGRSPIGAFDMVGGTWEWCSTLSKPYPHLNEYDDINLLGTRVIRGGSFNQESSGVRCAVRREDPPEHRGSSISFRLACNPR